MKSIDRRQFLKTTAVITNPVLVSERVKASKAAGASEVVVSEKSADIAIDVLDAGCLVNIS